MNFLLALLIAGLAHAGGISSTGGENHEPADGAAWFLGDASVRYCVEVSPQFGVSAPDAGAQIARAFQAWRDYIKRKHLNKPGSFGSDADMEARWNLDKIAMNTEARSTCDGSEDLKFYLGTSAPEVRQHIAEFAHPVAFAEKTAFDVKKAWGKGFIWVQLPGADPVVADAWKKPALLYGVLLHEIGHVLGNSHVGDTIMEEDVPVLAGQGGWNEGEARDRNFFTRIDNRRELYLCQDCDFDMAGKTGDPKQPGTEPNDDNFMLLTGRRPVGNVRSRVYTQNFADSYSGKIFLELQDDQGKTTLELSRKPFAGTLTMGFGDSPVFKKSRGNMEWARHSDSNSLLVRITTKTGKHYHAILTRNMGVSPLAVQLLETKAGSIDYIFSAETY